MNRTLLTATLALCLISAVHADTTRPSSARPEFGKDLSVDISSGFGAEGKRAGLANETWRWNGVARIDDNGTAQTQASIATTKSFDDASAQSERRGPRASHQRWIAINLDTGFEYSVDMPRAFAHQIHRYAQSTGSNMGDPRANNQPQQIDAALPQAKGWSNGVDTRTRRFDNTSYPFRAMGQMAGSEVSGCSGTFIARNIVLTAGHCIYNRGSDSFYSKAATRFRPGREGECNDASCEPYGAHDAIWYFTPAEFRENANPWPYDYGIMVVRGYPGDQTGWLGYYALSDDAMQDYCDDTLMSTGRCFNRGYPACGLSGAPAVCEQGWAYQDTNNCQIGGFGSAVNDGWNSRVRVSCDYSGGHSGSALFTDAWAGNKKVVFGVASTQDADVEFPNVFRRITPNVLDAISYFKAAYP